MDAAVKHCGEGIGIWHWASNDQAVAPDVVMACLCGDVVLPTLETLAAVSILLERLPELKIHVLNDLDRFHLAIDTIDRLPQTGDRGICLKQQLKDKLSEHKQYIDKHGQALPEIRNWRWKGSTA
jgi:phosphoketolase